jgi:hypothetical protein
MMNSQKGNVSRILESEIEPFVSCESWLSKSLIRKLKKVSTLTPSVNRASSFQSKHACWYRLVIYKILDRITF